MTMKEKGLGREEEEESNDEKRVEMKRGRKKCDKGDDGHKETALYEGQAAEIGEIVRGKED